MLVILEITNLAAPPTYDIENNIDIASILGTHNDSTVSGNSEIILSLWAM